jgi:hypothetical protein
MLLDLPAYPDRVPQIVALGGIETVRPCRSILILDRLDRGANVVQMLLVDRAEGGAFAQGMFASRNTRFNVTRLPPSLKASQR